MTETIKECESIWESEGDWYIKQDNKVFLSIINMNTKPAAELLLEFMSGDYKESLVKPAHHPKQSYFDKVDMGIKEQEIIFCPFCLSGYVTEIEYRSSINCPACEGYAEHAQKATQEIDDLYPLLDTLPKEKLEQLIRKLGAGLARSDFRVHWRSRG